VSFVSNNVIKYKKKKNIKRNEYFTNLFKYFCISPPFYSSFFVTSEGLTIIVSEYKISRDIGKKKHKGNEISDERNEEF
jgi:hypothetical protein